MRSHLPPLYEPSGGLLESTRAMYAVIETGGKQYRVEPGDVIDVERLAREDEERVVFDRVLMIGGSESVEVGTPLVAGAEVNAVAVGEVRGRKVQVFKRKRRKGYRRKTGHRQDYLRVRIEGIQGAGNTASSAAGEEE